MENVVSIAETFYDFLMKYKVEITSTNGINWKFPKVVSVVLSVADMPIANDIVC